VAKLSNKYTSITERCTAIPAYADGSGTHCVPMHFHRRER